MNLWPGARANGGMGLINGRSSAAPGVGKVWKKTEWTDPANRMLVADSNFWYVMLNQTDAAGTLSPQLVDWHTVPAAADGPGYMSVDRFRHGKYPSNNGKYFDGKNGQMKYNILYVDGHAVTSSSAADAYRAIRMRYP
ncbi:MAG TPA: hypothetical protein VF669_20430 [Tepidisphaeraceae bacterium]